jgi:hypothetical protein
MKHIKKFENFKLISEGLKYHIDNNLSLTESVYRIESESWISLVNEARDLWERNVVDLNEDDLFLISTDAGKYGIYEGNLVLLDVPFWEGEFDYDWEEYDSLEEAEYRGRDVKLNKPFRTSGGPRKFSVYTKNDSGNIVMTESFHIKRGKCCGNNCRHCPYEPLYQKGNTKLKESLRNR